MSLSTFLSSLSEFLNGVVVLSTSLIVWEQTQKEFSMSPQKILHAFSSLDGRRTSLLDFLHV